MLWLMGNVHVIKADGGIRLDVSGVGVQVARRIFYLIDFSPFLCHIVKRLLQFYGIAGVYVMVLRACFLRQFAPGLEVDA